MQYRRLGHTDLNVSAICLGTMTWGEQNTAADADAQLDYALHQGVNFVDTAELYAIPAKADTYGRTEQIIGAWLNKTGRRHDIILASKAAGPSWDTPETDRYIRGGARLNKQHLERALHASLARLQTDYVDLYQVHWPERRTNFFGKLGYEHRDDVDDTPILETLEALDALVKAGKVRYIGVSNETAWGIAEYLRLAEKHRLPRIVSCQNPYSLLNRSYEVGCAEFAARSAVGLLAYSPLAFGLLTGKYRGGAKPEQARLTRWAAYFTRYTGEQALAATEAYLHLADQHGLNPAQLALAYVNGRSFVTSNIIGATDMTQLADNIASIDLHLSDELLSALEAIHTKYPYPAP